MPLDLPSPPAAAIADSDSDESSDCEIWERDDLPQDAMVMKICDICREVQGN